MEIVKKFRENISKRVKIILKNDVSGITCGAILAKAFEREGVNFSLSFIQKLNAKTAKEINLDSAEFITLVGFEMSEKNIEKEHMIIESNECYYFARELNEKNKELAYLAVIEMCDSGKFAKNILDESGVEVKLGLRILGSKTRSLAKVLEQSIEPYILGVSGDEMKSIDFLRGLDIELKKNNLWRRLIDLNDDETKKLVTNIILKRLGSEKRADTLISEIYLLSKEPDDSPIKDLKEFSLMIKACCKLYQPSIALGACLGSKGYKIRALSLLTEYKSNIIKGLEWFIYHRKSDVIEKKGVVIAHFKSAIASEYLPEINKALVDSNIYDKNVILICMSYALDGGVLCVFSDGKEKALKIEEEKEFIDEILKKEDNICEDIKE